jgi:hypothetical protein
MGGRRKEKGERQRRENHEKVKDEVFEARYRQWLNK